ncbi:sensor domain-containing diguanylate cyclase [Nostoc sp. 3335mG]|nr:sensor domain-containing diguanylate cyclase [Nostoc sp. 3335mG]
MVRAAFRVARPLRMFLTPAVTGVAYYLAAFVSLFLTRGTDGVATLWPSSGILFAVLLMAPRSRIGWHVSAAAIGSLLANLQSGNEVLMSIGFTLANMSEAMLAAWLLKVSSRRISFVDPRSLTRFCTAAPLATAVAATIAVVAIPNRSLDFWFSWFATDLLGIFIVTPLMLIAKGIHRSGRNPVTGKTAAAATGLLVLVAVVAGITFAQSSYPLLFLPMLAVLIVTFRFGPFGAAGGVLIVALISSVAATLGSGPLVLVAGAASARSLFLQFYLLALFASALPIAALLAGRQRLTRQLADKMHLLELSEEVANVGHWQLSRKSRTVTWSREVFRIHGIEGTVSPTLNAAIMAYHPDDRTFVTEHIEQAIRENCGFAFRARIVRPDGEIRHVFSRGEAHKGTDDGPGGLFGIIQDITIQVAHETALEDARVRAEAAAARATLMAETDPLTGIANRRRTVCAMEEAVQAASDNCHPAAVAMFDIDHFKRINDTYGHQAGDEVLKRVARDASSELRSTDTLGRFGGEEFVIVLPDATADVAMMVAERVRVAVEGGGDNPRVTISVGIAELAVGETYSCLLRRADQALYAAKKGGRNVLRLAA